MKTLKFLLLPLVCGIGFLSIRCTTDPIFDEIAIMEENPTTRFPEYITGPSRVEMGTTGTFYVAPSVEYPNYVTWSIQGNPYGVMITNSTDTFAQVLGYASGTYTLVATIHTLGVSSVSTLTYSFQVSATSAPFYIQFESDYEQMIDIMIELQDGSCIDYFTGSVDWNYDDQIYRYRSNTHLPPGNHILWITSYDYPDINRQLPFTLPDKGGEYQMYWGTWGWGGPPTFTYAFSRF
jgi:hypothetical protein